MASLNHVILCHLLLLCVTAAAVTSGSNHEPEFDYPLPNLTVKQGTDVAFKCQVKHLGNHKVAWIKADEKVILAFHTHMVTQNPKFSVSHNGHNMWTLYIKGIQQNDTGSYMCQVNTNPARSQVGTLEVVVPADIIDQETSNDVVVKENDSPELVCKASGHPTPKVRWRRLDGQAIPLRKDLLPSPGARVETYEGERLPLRALQKSDTAAFYCIANNTVPPLVSKRVMVYVQFPPAVSIQNQLVATPIGSNVTLECTIEGLPKPFVSWFKRGGNLILSREAKYSIENEVLKEFLIKTRLTISNFSYDDVDDYNCSATNSLGAAMASVKLINYTIPETPAPSPPPKSDGRNKHKYASSGNKYVEHQYDRSDERGANGKSSWAQQNKKKEETLLVVTNPPKYDNPNNDKGKKTNRKYENGYRTETGSQNVPSYGYAITTAGPPKWSKKNEALACSQCEWLLLACVLGNVILVNPGLPLMFNARLG